MEKNINLLNFLTLTNIKFYVLTIIVFSVLSACNSPEPEVDTIAADFYEEEIEENLTKEICLTYTGMNCLPHECAPSCCIFSFTDGSKDYNFNLASEIKDFSFIRGRQYNLNIKMNTSKDEDCDWMDCGCIGSAICSSEIISFTEEKNPPSHLKKNIKVLVFEDYYYSESSSYSYRLEVLNDKVEIFYKYATSPEISLGFAQISGSRLIVNGDSELYIIGYIDKNDDIFRNKRGNFFCSYNPEGDYYDCAEFNPSKSSVDKVEDMFSSTNDKIISSPKEKIDIGKKITSNLYENQENGLKTILQFQGSAGSDGSFGSLTLSNNASSCKYVYSYTISGSKIHAKFIGSDCGAKSNNLTLNYIQRNNSVSAIINGQSFVFKAIF